MFASLKSMLSSRKKKEILIILKQRNWRYVGQGQSYTTISLDIPGTRYIVSASLSNVHVTVLDLETGRFVSDHKFAPQSLFFNNIDFAIYMKSHKKVKRLAKAHKNLPASMKFNHLNIMEP